MESKIGEANTQIFIFGWCKHILMGISFCYFDSTDFFAVASI